MYFVVIGGDIYIMDNFEKYNLDIEVEMKNGLIIFDIVCIYNNIEMCKDLMNCNNFRFLLDKFDVCGWIIVYFVVMVGNIDIFDNLIVKNVKMVKIKN